MTGGEGQRVRIMTAVLADMTPFREVPAPVDVSDAEAFPEIAHAIAHARRLRGEPINPAEGV